MPVYSGELTVLIYILVLVLALQKLCWQVLWFGISNLASKPWDNIRHSCEQDAGLAGYAWNKHSGRNFGDQTIIDKTNNVSIRTQFLKSVDGTDWTVRISGTPLPDSTTADISLLFYAGLDGQVKSLFDSYKTPSHQSDTDEDHHNHPASKNAPPPISSTAAAMNLPDLRDPVLIKLALPEDQVWNIKDHVRNLLIQNAQTLISTYSKTQQSNIPLQNLLHLGKNSPLDAPGNIALYQQTFHTSHKSPISREDIDSSVGSKLSHSLINAESQFDVRFENTFHLAERGFSESEIGFGKMLLSNMIGGMGYFHGTSMVDRAGWKDQPVFTDVPSRPFFPRGFFWDSGFHQHLIGVWDNDLSLDVIQSWASLIDEDGWVAREQILGRIGQSFILQQTITLLPSTLLPLISEPYTRVLKDSINGFCRMQWGQITEWGRSSTSQEAYRWRGRKGIHTLTSGLDDYPRSTEPHAGELHVDLLCWMALYSKTLGAISQELDLVESERDIWTPYGIASLSKSDPYFGTGENYWRGPIWINMNYLTLQSLFKNYMNKPGPYQQQAQRIYKNLRANIIKNVHEEYVKTGYVGTVRSNSWRRQTISSLHRLDSVGVADHV
ncbi:hypothetical protein BSLG_005973 [Batrachochytrium salamandrivorans]|nr:hypothetical protein BSLG_005973 [Batrachochytrium salamandrivorans]